MHTIVLVVLNVGDEHSSVCVHCGNGYSTASLTTDLLSTMYSTTLSIDMSIDINHFTEEPTSIICVDRQGGNYHECNRERRAKSYVDEMRKTNMHLQDGGDLYTKKEAVRERGDRLVLVNTYFIIIIIIIDGD